MPDATLPRAALGLPDLRRGALLVVLATALWSTSGVLVRLCETAAGWQVVLWRAVAMGGTLAAVILARYGGSLPRGLRAGGWTSLLAGCAFAAASACFILAVQTVTVANALFLSGAAPFIAALLARWLLGEPVGRATWLGIGVAAAGVAVMLGGSLTLDRLDGSLLALASAVAVAAFSFLLRRGRQADMLPAVFYAALLSAGVALPALWLGGQAVVPSWRDGAICAFMGAVQLGLGTILYARGARHVPAARLQLMATLELALSPLWVFLVVGEVPPAPTIAGGVLVLAATAMQVRPRTIPAT